MQHDDPVESWRERIAVGFAECPGLRLTAAQAARFWGLDRRRVDEILEELVRRAVLARTADGTFSRVSDLRRHATVAGFSSSRAEGE